MLLNLTTPTGRSPFCGINLRMIVNFARRCASAGFHNELSSEHWPTRSVASNGLRIKLLRELPRLIRKCRNISSSTRPNLCSQREFAPDTSAPELMQAKQNAILDIAVRLGRGEDFGQLAAAVSEDEASKALAGDLGFFAANRIPTEFFEAAEQLLPNGPPRFLQSHFGFHALQVTDVHPARLLTLAEATPEITALIAAEKRRNTVAALESELAGRARFVVE